MKPVVHIQDVSKFYGKVQALRHVSLEVMPGEIFGIIGPDGSGKTSLFRLLATLLTPDEGEIMVNGFDSITDYKAIRKCVGYMPGRFSLYPDLSVEENLDFLQPFSGRPLKQIIA